VGVRRPISGHCAGLGHSTLVSGEIVIPIRRFKELPIYDHIPVHGWPAMCIAAAIISGGLSMHFGLFWSRYPKWERFSSLAAICTGWAAGILFTIGIVAWSMMLIADFLR
jgi:hypothetical protein